jgi:hypothetical protein
MKNQIPNGNFEAMIAAKKLDLIKDESTKRIIEYIDLVFLENKMLVNNTATELANARSIMDVPIIKDINDLKRCVYGDDADVDEKTGILNKVNKMFRDWTFSKRMIALIWTVFGVSIVGIIITVVTMFIKLVERGF